jgi:lipid-binding SYLF domain-containing protein
MEETMRTGITASRFSRDVLGSNAEGRSRIWIALVLLAIGNLIAPSNIHAGPLAPTASDIDQRSRAALRNLFRENEAAKALAAQTKAILVFPDIKKGAFIIGAQYGYGALIEGTQTAGFYRTAAASSGFQAGVKKFGYALFFMTDAALHYLDASGGWALGTGPSLVVDDQGVARSLTTTNIRADVYAFVFDQQGLMGGIGLEGSKATKITRTTREHEDHRSPIAAS